MDIENHFQTKYLVVIGIILIIISLVYLFGLKNPKDSAIPQTAMTGRITEVTGSGIVVEAVIGGKNKVIKLIITPETIFNNSVIGATASQIKSGKPFTPQTTIIPGKISDLTKDMDVRVKTTDDLLKTSKTSVKEISYITHDFQL